MPTLHRQALLNERLNSRILFGGGQNGYSLNLQTAQLPFHWRPCFDRFVDNTPAPLGARGYELSGHP